MPAVSKAQQKFMGIVHGLQKGTVKPSDVSAKAKETAKSMKKKDAKDFASTKHKGLPEKVPENYIVDENTLTDLPDDVEYGYTKDGVVQCIASKNVCLTRMRDDRERNPGSKFQFIYSPTQQEGEIYEGIFDKVRRPSNAEYKVASDFAKKAGMELGSIGVNKKTGNINVELMKGNIAKSMVISPTGKVVKESKIKEGYDLGHWKKAYPNLAKKVTDDTIKKLSKDTEKYGGMFATYLGDMDKRVAKNKKIIPFHMWHPMGENKMNEDKAEKMASKFEMLLKQSKEKFGIFAFSDVVRKMIAKGEITSEYYLKHILKILMKKYNVQPQTSIDAIEDKVYKAIKKGNQVNEIKTDQDMVKDGLGYAKKKYKYDAKKMKDLARDLLMYIKSGEIDDQPSMEAYIDFRDDEMQMGEIKEIIRSVVREVLNEVDLNEGKIKTTFGKLEVGDDLYFESGKDADLWVKWSNRTAMKDGDNKEHTVSMGQQVFVEK